MQRLAREFGLSDVGLAKLCRRHRIPAPGRGYWAQLAAGQKPARIMLPTVDDPRLETNEICPSDRPAVDTGGEKQPVPTIEVAQDRPVECARPLGIRLAWADGKKQRVEKCLGRFLSALPLAAVALKKERAEQAERQRRLAEERRRQEEERRRREEYERKAKVIEKFAHSWNENNLVREFAAAFKAAAEGSSAPEDQKQELNAMVDFAVRHAAYVDPLTHPQVDGGDLEEPTLAIRHLSGSLQTTTAQPHDEASPIEPCSTAHAAS